ncbi:MAG: hypothetical protein JW715_12620 [Sedimentisphaerales bacterium]|nr:hypothetical protein [Sedimentisphaerales bacterium]
MTAKTKKIEKSNIKNQNCGVPASRDDFLNFAFCVLHFYFPVFLASVLCLAVTAGCQKADEKAQLLMEIEQLKEQNSELSSRAEKSESQNEDLQNRVRVLAALPDDVKGENLYTLNQVRIGRYTGFYDKNNNDDIQDTLIVYVQPLDDQLDKIKASGTVEIELWDLDKPDGQAKLKTWKIEPDELRALWYATMLTINYRLTLDIADIVKDFDKPYTVKMKFTDYLSGKIFEAQRIIKN